MRDELLREKALLSFYKEFVSFIQDNKNVSSSFLEQAFVTMLMGHEFCYECLCKRKSYELLLMLNISGNLDIKDNDNYLEKLTYPFSLVDKDGYYSRLVCDNFLLVRELLMLSRLANDLEKGDNNSIALRLLNVQNGNCIETFNNFNKLRDILRTGWIKRNVEVEYLESDATHIMQMMAFASAYFVIFNPTDLDFDKVMEMILIHEVGEVLAGDIPEGDLLHNSKHNIEARGVMDTFSKLNNGEYFIKLWEEFEKKESNEAKFVYELDKFDPIAKAEYLDEKLGRTDLLPDFYVYEEKRGTFEGGKLKKVFKCLEEKVNS